MTSAHRRLSRVLANDPTLVETAAVIGDAPCWVAGGWIRDRAIGRIPPDLDLVVSGDDSDAADAAARLGRAHGARPYRLGRPPRAIWSIQGRTLRVEVWPLGDLTPENDAARRDFSCNSMLWRLPDGPLVDPCGGLPDIQTKTVRAVARANLTADPVRLLRGPRFVASLSGFSLDPETATWIEGLGDSLSQAPKERLGAELHTMASALRPGDGFRIAHELGLLSRLSPMDIYEPNLEALRRLTGALPHPVPSAVREVGGEAILAWLVKSWGVTSSGRLSPFAWNRTTVHRILSGASQCEALVATVRKTPADRREIIYRTGTAFPTVFTLAAAAGPDSDEHTHAWHRLWRQWRRSGPAILESKLHLSANQVADLLGLAPGPRLGRCLAALKTAVVRREVRSSSGAVRWLRSYSC